MAIGSTVTSGTTGSVLFIDGSGNLGQNNAKFFWDNTGIQLSIGTATALGALTVTQTAASSGVLATAYFTPGANTGLTASTNAPQIVVATSTQTYATGALATYDYAQINAPTLAFAGASTVTNASTFTINGSPISGTNATITNTWALTVNGATKMYSTVLNAITPPGALTAALITTAGNIDAGSHSYKVTFVTLSGKETLIGTISNAVVNDGSNQQNALSAIPTAPIIGNGLVTKRNIYRNKVASQTTWFLLTTLNDNTTTTYTDNTADASLSATVPPNSDQTGALTIGGLTTFNQGVQFTSGQNGTPPGTVGIAYNNGAGYLQTNVPTGVGYDLMIQGVVVFQVDQKGSIACSPVAGTSGNHSAFSITPANNTGQTAGGEQIQFAVNGSSITWANGTVALQRYAVIGKSFLSGTSGTQVFTQAEGLNVSAPATSSNALITTAYGINVNTNVSLGAAVAGTSYAAYSAGAHTLTITGTTEVTSNDMSMMRLDVLTITDGNAITVDSAATMTIVGPPIAAGSVTLTNAYAIRVKAGNSRFDGSVASTATAITLAASVATFAITSNGVTLTGDSGTNTVTTITGGMSGQILVISFADSNVTLSDSGTSANQLDLVSSCSSALHKTITLWFNGTFWSEICRAVDT